ncbi:MAG TPA: glycosyltransferase family 2 protein [Candidatus Hydrogenedentes bacterium]|nr:glycosyltransferase family 2 protein [Candidatus Hydrogenedentota bacterium]HPG65816.1 glycosyltransferase family 2 protein [Candidatus Hydrogenedentota bacterium]
MSVILPCLDEEGTVGACVRQIRTALDGAGIRGEVIVADNGSTDASVECATREGARVVEVRARGYGNALREGLAAARSRCLVFMDADLSYAPSDVPAFVAALRDGAALVIGSRMRGSIEPGAMPRLHRRLGTPVLTGLANLFFGCGITDINCGMRALTKDTLDKLNLHSDGMEFASEMMIKAAQAGIRITEIPIAFHVDQRGREPHLRSFRDGWRHLQLILHFAPLWVFFGPGLVLTLGGLAILWPEWDWPTALPVYLTALSASLLGVEILLVGIIAQGRVTYSKHLNTNMEISDAFRRLVRIEKGVVLGGIIAAAGAMLLGHALWKTLGLEAGQAATGVIREALLAALLFISGALVFFASLFMGLFGLRVVDDEVGPRRTPTTTPSRHAPDKNPAETESE